MFYSLQVRGISCQNGPWGGGGGVPGSFLCKVE